MTVLAAFDWQHIAGPLVGALAVAGIVWIAVLAWVGREPPRRTP